MTTMHLHRFVLSAVFMISLPALCLFLTSPVFAEQKNAYSDHTEATVDSSTTTTSNDRASSSTNEVDIVHRAGMSREEFFDMYRDRKHPGRMVINPVKGRPFTMNELQKIWVRYQNIDNDEAYRQITLLSKASSDAGFINGRVARSSTVTPKSEQDMHSVIRFFSDFTKTNWRDPKNITSKGPRLLRRLQGMNRSRFSTAVANMSRLDIDSMTLLLEAVPDVSLRSLQTFFRQDKRILVYVISHTPGHERMLKSLGGVETISYTMDMIKNKEIASLIESIEAERIQALNNPGDTE